VRVEIKPHELHAMQQLIMNVRAMAGIIRIDDNHTKRLLNWTQMLEDVVDRVEMGDKHE
jgi:hypothetical protein